VASGAVDWEKVHTVHSYYDGPVLGIADFRGRPHIYERIFEESTDKYSDRYYIATIESELLAWVMEAWEIWLRWKAAFDQGKVKVAVPPAAMALPADHRRHLELKHLIGDRLRAKSEGATVKRAVFRTEQSRALQVRWSDP
jgi:hypothetical protein